MTKFYISANKTLVSNGQIKIRVGETTAAPTTTTTTTAAPAGNTLTVSGLTGEQSGANGVYVQAGTYNGKPYYAKGSYVQTTYEPFVNGEYIIIWAAFGLNMWNWYNNETASFSASNTSDTPTPPTTDNPGTDTWVGAGAGLIITGGGTTTTTTTSAPTTTTAAPGVQGYTVSGVVDAGWASLLNGSYCPNGTLNGRTEYVNASTGADIYWTGSYWAMSNGQNMNFEAFINLNQGSEVPTSGWQAEEAYGPPPTVTQTTC